MAVVFGCQATLSKTEAKTDDTEERCLWCLSDISRPLSAETNEAGGIQPGLGSM